MVPLHMGPLHPYEQALTLLLAFGPFLLLGVVIAVRRRAEARGGAPRDERAAPAAPAAPEAPAAPDREETTVR